MRFLLVIITVLDLALAMLLISVSGFILQGVTNTGPMMPEAIFYVFLIVSCFAFPLGAWVLRDRMMPGVPLLVAGLPLALAAIALLLPPLLTFSVGNRGRCLQANDTCPDPCWQLERAKLPNRSQQPSAGLVER